MGVPLSALVQALQIVQVSSVAAAFSYAAGLRVLVRVTPSGWKVSPGKNAGVWIGPTSLPFEPFVAVNLVAPMVLWILLRSSPVSQRGEEKGKLQRLLDNELLHPAFKTAGTALFAGSLLAGCVDGSRSTLPREARTRVLRFAHSLSGVSLGVQLTRDRGLKKSKGAETHQLQRIKYKSPAGLAPGRRRSHRKDDRHAVGQLRGIHSAVQAVDTPWELLQCFPYWKCFPF